MQHALCVDGKDPVWRENLMMQEGKERFGVRSLRGRVEMVPSAHMEVLALERSTENSPRRIGILQGTDTGRQ